MRIRYVTILIIICMLAALASGCAGDPAVEENQPVSAVEGYYGGSQDVTGGSAETLFNANIKRVDVERQEDDTVVTLSFISGSRAYDMEEATLDAVPAYNIYCLPFPNRLVVSLKGIAYWDFNESETPDNPIVEGMFRCTDSIQSEGSGSESDISIYFQLSGEVVYQVEEQQDKLVLRMRSVEEEEAPKFFVTANLFYDFQEGAINRDLGMLPALCSDKEHKILVSEPYETRELAVEKQKALQSDSKFAAQLLPIVELPPGELLEYNDQIEEEAVYKKNVVSKGGNPSTLPVLMSDGMYLCSTPDGSIMLFARTLLQHQDEDADSLEAGLDVTELWTVDQELKKERLTDTDFSTIQQAAYSPDGKKLALLNQGREDNTLFIIDLEDGNALYNVGEEGFGSTTSFVWDDNSHVVYAVTGATGIATKQLMKYDLNAREGERASSVVDREMGDGSLAYLDGHLYFGDHEEDSDTGSIYRLNPQDLQMEEYAKGENFRISPDRQHMVIQELVLDPEAQTGESDPELEDADASAEGGYTLSLKLKDMTSGEETYVVEGQHFSGDVEWDHGGHGLYYMTISDDAGDFPNRLWWYDIEAATNTELMDVAGTVHPTSEDKKLLLVVDEFSDQMSKRFFVTYVLELTN